MATVKPGDLVRFIDEVGEGRVIRIVSDEMAEVETNDGWVLPVYIRTLVVIPEKPLPGKTTVVPAKVKEIKAAILEKEVAGTAANKVPASKPSNPKTPPREVDLHINKLMDSVVGMTNTEILTVQLDIFRRELNQAIRNNEREIIFIHGIGNGTLKGEIRRVAGQEYKWCSQEDASFREYGFGATRIRIPQNKPF
jgi:hypothetical protein